MLESASLDSDQDRVTLNYEVVNRSQLSRHIDVKEYGSERIFMSHAEGLGSMSFFPIYQRQNQAFVHIETTFTSLHLVAVQVVQRFLQSTLLATESL